MTNPKAVTLIHAANTLRVHPRTILRAMTGNHNTYWYEDSNEEHYYIRDIAEAYGMTELEFRRCLEGRDEFLDVKEASAILGCGLRTLKKWADRGHYKRVNSGNVVRYFKSEILEAKIAAEE